MVVESNRRIREWQGWRNQQKAAAGIISRFAASDRERVRYVESLRQMAVGILVSYGFAEWVMNAGGSDLPVAELRLNTMPPQDWINGVPHDEVDTTGEKPHKPAVEEQDGWAWLPLSYMEAIQRDPRICDSYTFKTGKGETLDFDVVEHLECLKSADTLIALGVYGFALASRSRLVIVNSDGTPLPVESARTLLNAARKSKALTMRERLAVARPEGALN